VQAMSVALTVSAPIMFWSSYATPMGLVFAIYFFFAVLADSLKALAVGAPLSPGLRIFSFEPAAMRACFALMLA
jgi:hypothetical protein